MDVIGFLCVSLGSSTVQLHDSLGSRCACAYSEACFSSQNGDLLEECITEEQCSVVRFFCGQNDSVQRIFIKKCFMFMLGSGYGGKRFVDDEEVETEVRNWLRQ
jgi:hypothetical protein